MISSALLAASNGGFWAPIANPLAAVLAFFYGLVPNYGIAIVLLTILMMIVLTPLTIKQTRSMLVMQKLQPEMKKLQEQHKNDRQALNEAVMALYKEHNASPLGGCLPMLLPFPLFIGLLRVLEGLSHTVKDPKTHVVTAMPKYLTSHTRMFKDIVAAHGQLDAFGMNLAKSARNVGGGFGHSLPYFVLLLVMVGTQFYQQYQLTSKNPAASSQPGQAMMMKLIPLVFGVISLNFPAGVVLYWTVSNMIRIGQQWALYRYDPKVKALVTKDVKEIEARTREIDARNATPKGSGRSRLRDLMSNAAEAATDRKGLGKGDAKPGSRPVGENKGSPARGGSRSPAGKATTPTPGVNKSQRPGTPPSKAGGAQKGGPQRPGAPKPGLAKAGPAKPGSPQGAKPGTAKPGTPRPGAAKAGTTTPGAAKPGAAKPGTPTPGTPKTAAPSPGAPKPSTPKAGAPNPGAPKAGVLGAGLPGAGAIVPTSAEGRDAAERKTTPVKPGASADPVTTVNGTSVPSAGSGNGSTPPAAASNGSAANGTDAASAAAKGRTGGGSARNVSSRRRRKGR